MIKITSATKSYGDIKALDNLDLEIEDGEFVFIVGPSGAGKTTFLELIFGKTIPDTGEVIIDKENIVDYSDRDVALLRQRVGVVFQDFKVLNERTVGENVEVALAVLDVDETEWNDRIKSVLEMVGIGDKADYFPAQLSGGELQRVSLARALAVDPKIVLADEPTGNLDWDTAEQILEVLRKINKDGRTIIFATHHKGLVETHPGRVIEFKDGKIIKDTKKKTSSKNKKSKKKEGEKEKKK